MLKAVIFDFDGTLVKSNHLKHQGFLAIAAQEGQRALMESILSRNHGDRFEIFRTYVSELGAVEIDVETRINSLVVAYTKQVDDEVATAPEILGAEKLLGWINKKDVPVYLSSATPIDSLKNIVSKRGWDHYFSAIYGRPQTKLQTLNVIAAKHNATKEHFAVVGDGLDDFESAEIFGCHFIGVGEREQLARRCPIYELDQVVLKLTQLGMPSRSN